MKSFLSTILLLPALALPVAAKPLPSGMKITEKDNELIVTWNGVTVPLLDSDEAASNMYSKPKSAKLSDDGKSIIVKAANCREEGTDPDAPDNADDRFETGPGTIVSLAYVEARIENSRGMQVHLKKKYDEAIAHFTVAAQKDPNTPMYATNLLSAQSLAGKLDDADRTLATYGPGHPRWFAVRLAVDPELASVQVRPSAKPFAAEKPSKLTYRALGESVAISPLGFVAIREWSDYSSGEGGSGEDLGIYDLQQSPLLRITVVSIEDVCGGKHDDRPCTKPMRARIATRTRNADRMLATLGFEKQPTHWIDNMGPDHRSARYLYVSPDKKTSVRLDEHDDKLTITRGKTSQSIKEDGEGLQQVGFAGDLVVLKKRQTGYLHCSGDAQRSYSVVLK